MTNCQTEIVRHVSDDKLIPLTIRSWPEATSCVWLLAESNEAREYWGAINLSLPKEMADALGRALIAAAAEARSD